MPEAGTAGVNRILVNPGMTVTARMPEPKECQLHGFDPGTPLMVITHPSGNAIVVDSSTEVVFGAAAD